MGRKQKRAAAAVWRNRLARFRRSHLTVAEFCRREGVSNPSFYQWRKRLDPSESRASAGRHRQRSATTHGDPASPFVPVTVVSSPMAEIEFPNGVRIRVPADSAKALRMAIRAGSQLCQETPPC